MHRLDAEHADGFLGSPHRLTCKVQGFALHRPGRRSCTRHAGRRRVPPCRVFQRASCSFDRSSGIAGVVQGRYASPDCSPADLGGFLQMIPRHAQVPGQLVFWSAARAPCARRDLAGSACRRSRMRFGPDAMTGLVRIARAPFYWRPGAAMMSLRIGAYPPRRARRWRSACRPRLRCGSTIRFSASCCVRSTSASICTVAMTLCRAVSRRYSAGR